MPPPLVIAEPQPGALWPDDPRLGSEVRALLVDLGATILPLESRDFGAAYPHGNKIEAMGLMDGPHAVPGQRHRDRGPAGRHRLARRPPRHRSSEATPGPSRRSTARRATRSGTPSITRRTSPSRPRRTGHGRWITGAGISISTRDGSMPPTPPPCTGPGATPRSCCGDRPPDAILGQSLDPWLDQAALPVALDGLRRRLARRAGATPSTVTACGTGAPCRSSTRTRSRPRDRDPSGPPPAIRRSSASCKRTRPSAATSTRDAASGRGRCSTARRCPRSGPSASG